MLCGVDEYNLHQVRPNFEVVKYYGFRFKVG